MFKPAQIAGGSTRPSREQQQAMQQMSDKIFDTPLCIIKRHKNRGRYELYIHDEKLRDFVKGHQLDVVDEDLSDVRVLKKKTLFKRLGYGKVLALILDRLNTYLMVEIPNPEQLNAWLSNVNAKLKQSQQSQLRSDFETDEDYWAACYGAANAVVSSDRGSEDRRSDD